MMGWNMRSWSCCIFFACLFSLMGFFVTSSSASTFLSDSVFESRSAAGRNLLQARKACPVNFEFMNYTVITSQCKGPSYPPKECCSAFKDFACPYNDVLNDVTNDCASTMFSYINLYGKYPPGLFASECREVPSASLHHPPDLLLLQLCNNIHEVRQVHAKFLVSVGRQVHCWVIKAGGELGSYVHSSLTHLYATLGLMDDAEHVCGEVLEENVDAVNATISGYCRCGRVDEARTKFEGMTDRNVASWSAMITIHRELYLRGDRCTPTSKGCMVDLLGRAERPAEAHELIASMPKEANSVIWGAFLSSCRVHNDVKRGAGPFNGLWRSSQCQGIGGN
ncbi:unnamed protein product [Linum tenue]|uniref:GPI-anchored protein LLG1-like domain-containing protein n=1 Tax=Linum tenue TaxID=586396 RepID=A0AAV0Q6V1_9ROSI|nr:unnamed protein product [Linum tenue]